MNTLIIFSAKYLLIVSAAITLAYFFKQPRQKQKEILIFAVIIFPLSYVIAKIAGHFYFDARPFVAGHFTPLIPHAADNGFPSDHVLLASAIAAAVLHFSKRIGLVLYVVAFLIGTARVLAGIHHFTDVFGSIAVSLVAYVLVLWFMKWRVRNNIAHF